MTDGEGDLGHQVIAAFRALAGPMPWAQSERGRHEDLASMTEQRLWQERERTRFVLAWQDDPDAWLVERVRAVETELARRKAGQR